MTENLPAVPEQPSRALAHPTVADTDSWVEVMRPVIALAERICDTTFVPKGLRGSAPATAAAMLYGREVGLPPMSALSMTHVVDGTPGISAQAMRALILAAGHEIEFVESTGAICTMRGRRRGQENWLTINWTIDMGRAAGLLGKDNWKNYPRRMLQARCTSELAEMVFPDVIQGFRAVEDLDDQGEEAEAGPAPIGATRVARATKRTAAKKSTPAPLEQAQRPTPAAGPPLPGEEGYDPALEPGKASAPSGDGEPSSQDEPAGKNSEDGADATGEGDEPTVEETTDTEPGEAGSAPEGEKEPPAEPEGEAGNAGGSDTPITDAQRGPRPATRAQLRGIFAFLNEFGVGDADRHALVSRVIGREVTSFDQLTHANASTVIETFGRVKSLSDLEALLEATEAGS